MPISSGCRTRTARAIAVRYYHGRSQALDLAAQRAGAAARRCAARAAAHDLARRSDRPPTACRPARARQPMRAGTMRVAAEARHGRAGRVGPRRPRAARRTTTRTDSHWHRPAGSSVRARPRRAASWSARARTCAPDRDRLTARRAVSDVDDWVAVARRPGTPPWATRSGCPRRAARQAQDGPPPFTGKRTP